MYFVQLKFRKAVVVQHNFKLGQSDGNINEKFTYFSYKKQAVTYNALRLNSKTEKESKLYHVSACVEPQRG